MIGRIRGNLVDVIDNVILVDVNGVGYELEVPSGVLAGLVQLPGGEGREAVAVTLYTHLVVREDAQQLYGFASRSERDLFRAYIRISGVGPKLALSLISSVGVADLARAVRDKDTALLTRVPGIGKKTAERLLVELRDRLPVALEPASQPVSGGAGRAASAVVTEAEHALVALGYRPAEAMRVIDSIRSAGNEDIGSAEALVRAALRRLAGRSEVAS
ncbi:MAG: Holliday junction branch migration protein RuvA [Pseudomonadales bacterium]